MKTPFHLLVRSLFLLFFLAVAACSPGKKEQEEQQQEQGTLSELDKLNARVSKDSRNPDVLLERARYFNTHKRFSSALNDMQAAIAIDSMRADLWMAKAEAHFGLVQVPPARDGFRRVIALDPSVTEAWLKLAELSLYIKAYPEAIESANGALKNDERNKKAYFIKGFVYKESGDTARAVSSFQTCLELDASYYEACMQLGILFAAKRDPRALQYYDRALQLRNRSVEAYYDRAMFYQEAGQYNKAMEDYTALLAIEPRNKMAHFNLGYIHLAHLKVYRQAIVHFSDAIRCDSNYIEAWYNRGISFENLGDVMHASEDYRKALTLYPKYELARQGLKRVSN